MTRRLTSHRKSKFLGMRRFFAFAKCSLVLAIFGILASGANAEESTYNDDYIYERWEHAPSSGENLSGLLHRPIGHNQPNASFPIVIGFHGTSDHVVAKGDGGHNSQFANLLSNAKTSGQKFFLYLPQALAYQEHWRHRDIESTFRVLSRLLKQYPAIDRTRIYVTGLSLGGGATWRALGRFGGITAAAVPICSSYNGKQHWNDAVGVPIWTFSATNDTTPNANSAATQSHILKVHKLTNPGAPNPTFQNSGSTTSQWFQFHTHDAIRYSRNAVGGHTIWPTIWSGSALYSWLLANSLADISGGTLQINEIVQFDLGDKIINEQQSSYPMADKAPNDGDKFWNSSYPDGLQKLEGQTVIPYAQTSSGRTTWVSLEIVDGNPFVSSLTFSGSARYGTRIGTDGWVTESNATATTNTAIIRISGLVPGSSYTVDIYGAGSGSDLYETRYEINSETRDLDGLNNTTEEATFESVQADENGTFDLKVYTQNGSGKGVINTLKITRLPDSILFQDFEGSTDVGSYVHATDPGKTKFNDIGSTGTAATVTWSIDNGTLKLVRGGSAITGAGFTRYAGDPADEPDVLLASFDLKVSDLVLNSNSSLGTLEIGDFTSAGAYYNPSSNASTTNRLEVRSVYTGTNPAATKWRFALTGTSGLVSLPGPTGSTFEQSDTVTVYWVLNARDTAIEYTLNDSTSHSLGAKSSNLHVARNNGSMELLTSTGIPFNDAVWTSTKLSGLRFYSKSANAITLRFDNFDVGPFTIEE